MKVKAALHSLVLTVLIASIATAENYYVDVNVCSNPPAAIEWNSVTVQVSVWDDGNWFGNSSHKKLSLMLGQARSSESRHLLKGTPKKWHVAIGKGSQRVKGYGDGKEYLISWPHTGSYNNTDISNVTALHINFTWALDPSY